MTNKQRAAEFLDCLGNGKPIHQCELEDELMEEQGSNSHLEPL